jgi:hypothetical protein
MTYFSIEQISFIFRSVLSFEILLNCDLFGAILGRKLKLQFRRISKLRTERKINEICSIEKYVISGTKFVVVCLVYIPNIEYIEQQKVEQKYVAACWKIFAA